MSVVRVDLHDKLFLVFVVELAYLAVLIAACTYALVSTASIFFLLSGSGLQPQGDQLRL